MRELPEGKIDPFLKTITFARGDKPLVPAPLLRHAPTKQIRQQSSHERRTRIAREKLQAKEGVFQVYFTGCGGDITLGKYNDGSSQRP